MKEPKKRRHIFRHLLFIALLIGAVVCLRPMLSHHSPPSAAKQACMPHRLTVMTWNTGRMGGFVKPEKNEVLQYLLEQDADVVCLQHGLTIQKIAQYQNKFYDNTKHYFCVSPKEVENITKPIYGYTEDMITLTGAPRYDGLTGEPKKQILITPTWRRNVTAGTNEKGKQHEYSVNFKRTTYYKIYNSLINDKRLIDAAKRTGYRIVYLVHPILSPQAGDYDKNDFVDIVPGVKANYEKMLKESALMVTDYSGIQFDFAYMRRPLVYFHPAELPPQYAEEDTGFGPICRTNEELIDQLINAMESDCKLEEDYKKKIDAFFPFDDQNACKRVYEAAKKL